MQFDHHQSAECFHAKAKVGAGASICPKRANARAVASVFCLGF